VSTTAVVTADAVGTFAKSLEKSFTYGTDRSMDQIAATAATDSARLKLKKTVQYIQSTFTPKRENKGTENSTDDRRRAFFY